MKWLPDYNTMKGRLARLLIFGAGPFVAVFWLPTVQTMAPDATPAWREYYVNSRGEYYDWLNSWQLADYDRKPSDALAARIDQEALFQTCLLSTVISGAVFGSIFFVMKPKFNSYVKTPGKYVKVPCDGSCGSRCPSHIPCTNPDCTCTNHAVFGIAMADALPPERLADSTSAEEA